MRRTLIILSPLILTWAILYGTYSAFENEIQIWVMGQIESFSIHNLPVRISGSHFEILLLNPGLKFSKVKIFEEHIEQPLEIEEISLHLDFLQALGGRVVLSNIVLSGAFANLDLDKFTSKEEGSSTNLHQIFQQIQRLPIYHLSILESNVNLRSDKHGGSLNLGDINFRFFNQKGRIATKLDIGSADLKIKNSSSPPLPSLPFHLKINTTLSAESLQIHEAELSAFDTKIQLHGEFDRIKELFKTPTGKFEFKISSTLAKLARFLPENKTSLTPKGEVQAQGSIQLHQHTLPTVKGTISGKSLEIGAIKVGDLNLTGSYAQKLVQISDLLIHHDAGDIRLEKVELDTSNLKAITAHAKLSTDQVDLHDLLTALDIGDLDLDAFLNGNFDCKGNLTPSPLMECKGLLGAEQLEIRTGDSYSDSILNIDALSASGGLKITDTAVSYTADLHINKDLIKTEGTVSYQDGFKINYSTNEFQLNNLQNMAHLSLSGSGQFSGATKGDSKSAVFFINSKISDTVFEKFKLGAITTTIDYRSGQLGFNNLNGELGISKYSGNVQVNLPQQTLQSEIQFSSLELKDLLSAVEQRATLPFEITGRGSGAVKVSGPFELGKLSYILSMQAYRGQIAGETFDRAQVNVTAEKGEVKITNAILVKSQSKITATGVAHPSGQINISVTGDKFLLEESENITRLSSATNGIFNFQVGLSGFILTPDVSMKASLSGLFIEEQEFPDSNVNFVVTNNSLEGKAQLLGSRLKSEFIIPLSANSPFKLKVQATDWNFATLSALIGGGSLLSEYQTSITGDLDLSSERGGFFHASGDGNITRFILKRGPLSLANQQTASFIMRDGVMSFSNFKFTNRPGDVRSALEIRGNQFTADHLLFNVDADLPLHLFHIFLPFLEDFSGHSNISVAVSGKLTKPEILGTGKIDQGFIKIRGFPHPFERLLANIQFSISKILISNLTGQIAGGSLHGDGTIQIEGPQSLPLNITAKLEGATLNVPAGVKTFGDADLLLSGNWFPFQLSGTYFVKGGLVSKEFGEDSQLSGLRQSSYLPKIILQSAFEPISLNIQNILEKPLPIKNSLMEGSITGQIQVKGIPTQPSLTGRIECEKNSKLMFKDKVFDVSTGNVQFKNPNEINPELYFAGRSRVNDYDINLLVQGLAKNPLIRLSSSPPLSESDIISLLALGVVAAKTDKVRRNEDQTSAMTIGSALISNTKYGRDLQETFGVNLQLSSSYDDTKNVSVQKVTLSKKLTDKLHLSASRVQGSQSSNEYKLRYLINNNVSAVGSYEERLAPEESKTTDALKKNENILGIDLEYKREFK